MRRRRGIPDETDEIMRYESLKRQDAAIVSARAATKAARKAEEQAKRDKDEQVVKPAKPVNDSGGKVSKVDEAQALAELFGKIKPRT